MNKFKKWLKNVRKEKPLKQIDDEYIKKSEILRVGIETPFWKIIEEGINEQIEAGRDALESPVANYKGVTHKNAQYWEQFQRGCINALRLILERPEVIIDKARNIHEKLAEEQENKKEEKS